MDVSRVQQIADWDPTGAAPFVLGLVVVMVDFSGHDVSDVAARRDPRPHLGSLAVVLEPLVLIVFLRLFRFLSCGRGFTDRRHSGVAVAAARMSGRVAIRTGGLPRCAFSGRTLARLLG
jgi:hypothetical protein